MTPGRVTVLTENFNQTRRIWTDGRAHPPADELEYTFQGDSVGRWQGDTLVVDTALANWQKNSRVRVRGEQSARSLCTKPG